MNDQANNWQDTYLTNRVITYTELLGVQQGSSNEPFELLPMDPEKLVFGRYNDKLGDMKKVFPQIPVRSTVSHKLTAAAQELLIINPTFRLCVTYGYRSLLLQKKYFRDSSQKIFGTTQLNELQKEKIHTYIAVPSVAGHPTGGAIDITLFDTKTKSEVPMGSDIYDFDSPSIQTFSSSIDSLGKSQRFLLRKLLMQQGFAPFDGEWWHFSYGDKEWAYYYNQKQSLYPQVNLTPEMFR